MEEAMSEQQWSDPPIVGGSCIAGDEAWPNALTHDVLAAAAGGNAAAIAEAKRRGFSSIDW
jgi:hypothetical protein